MIDAAKLRDLRELHTLALELAKYGMHRMVLPADQETDNHPRAWRFHYLTEIERIVRRINVLSNRLTEEIHRKAEHGDPQPAA